MLVPPAPVLPPFAVALVPPVLPPLALLLVAKAAPPAPAVPRPPPSPPAAVEVVPPALRSAEPLLHPATTKTAVSRLAWKSFVFLDFLELAIRRLDRIALLGFTNRVYAFPASIEATMENSRVCVVTTEAIE
jgi:hypothetical protein